MEIERPCGCKLILNSDAEKVKSLITCDKHNIEVDRLQPLLTEMSFSFW